MQPENPKVSKIVPLGRNNDTKWAEVELGILNTNYLVWGFPAGG